MTTPKPTLHVVIGSTRPGRVGVFRPPVHPPRRKSLSSMDQWPAFPWCQRRARYCRTADSTRAPLAQGVEPRESNRSMTKVRIQDCLAWRQRGHPPKTRGSP